MSYMTFQQQCEDCKAIWNAAFGIVNMVQIAAPPSECPKCKSKNLFKIPNHWDFESQSSTVNTLPPTFNIMTEETKYNPSYDEWFDDPYRQRFHPENKQFGYKVWLAARTYQFNIELKHRQG